MKVYPTFDVAGFLFDAEKSRACKWVDSGYQGIQHVMDNVFLPKKSSKKSPLSDQEKEDNKFISSTQILVENAIGGMKRFGCLTQKLRNRIGIDDS